MEKARALGIPKGPLYGKLKAGESIELPNATTIFPHQVVENEQRGRNIAIICSFGEDFDTANDQNIIRDALRFDWNRLVLG